MTTPEPLRPPPIEAESAWLGWVYRASTPITHTCQPPMRQEMIRVPFAGIDPPPVKETELVPWRKVPDGAEGDIWGCGCRRDGQYWVIAHPPQPRGGGYIGGGLAWRPITARKARRLVRRAERRAK